MAWLSSLFSVIAQGLGLGSTVQAEKNSPAMQANKSAEAAESAKAKIEKDVADGDIDEIRKDIAE